MRFVKEKQDLSLNAYSLSYQSISFLFENVEGVRKCKLENVKPLRDCSSLWISIRPNILIHNYIKA